MLAIMGKYTPLNYSLSPQGPQNSHQCCQFAIGYCIPSFLVAFVCILYCGAMAAAVQVIVYSVSTPTKSGGAWRIFVALIIMMIVSGLQAVWLITYFRILRSSPGYVLASVWKYPPIVCPIPTKRQDVRTAHEAVGNEGGGESAHVAPPAPILSPSAPPPLSSLSPTHPLRLFPPSSSLGQESEATHDAHPPTIVQHPMEDGTTWMASMEAGGQNTATGQFSAASSAEELQHTRCDPFPYRSPSGMTVTTATTTMSALPPLARRNPYAVHQSTANGGARYCNYCELYKPDHAFHCKSCQRCVYRFDHHCPWVNNCVGRNNFRVFVSFLFNSFLCSTLTGVLVLVSTLVLYQGSLSIDFSTLYRFIVAGLLLILGLSLLLFYVQMMGQLNRGVSTVETFIEEQQWLQQQRTLQRERHEQRLQQRRFVDRRPRPSTASGGPNRGNDENAWPHGSGGGVLSDTASAAVTRPPTASAHSPIPPSSVPMASTVSQSSESTPPAPFAVSTPPVSLPPPQWTAAEGGRAAASPAGCCDSEGCAEAKLKCSAAGVQRGLGVRSSKEESSPWCGKAQQNPGSTAPPSLRETLLGKKEDWKWYSILFPTPFRTDSNADDDPNGIQIGQV